MSLAEFFLLYACVAPLIAQYCWDTGIKLVMRALSRTI